MRKLWERLSAEATGQTFVAKCISLAALNDQDQELPCWSMSQVLCQSGSERSYGKDTESNLKALNCTAGERSVLLRCMPIDFVHKNMWSIFLGQVAWTASTSDCLCLDNSKRWFYCSVDVLLRCHVYINLAERSWSRFAASSWSCIGRRDYLGLQTKQKPQRLFPKPLHWHLGWTNPALLLSDEHVWPTLSWIVSVDL